MVSEGNGWWKYFIAGDSCSSIIFNNHSSPQTTDLSHCGDGWFDGTMNTWIENPLPVKLISFTGTVENGNVTLRWKTTNEASLKGYYLERNDGGGYQDIAFVVSKGNGNYQFTDEKFSTINKASYRIRIVDKDGTYRYSNELFFDLDKDGITLFPNPAKDNISISFGNQVNTIASYQLSLIDIEGKLISTTDVRVGNNSTKIYNLPASLKAGNYLMTITNKETSKVVVKKIQVVN